MNDPAATPVGATQAPRGIKFYKSGPWLIVYGHGPDAEARAGIIAKLCAARGVDCHLVAADEVGMFTLHFYTALIVVLPAATAGEQATSHDRLLELIRAYRARRPDGLDGLIRGRRWFEVGVVQVFDDRTGRVRPMVEAIQDVICQYHQRNWDEPLTPFACYENLCEPGQGDESVDQGDTIARAIETLQGVLRQWGIGWTMAEVTTILGLIEGMRYLYESPAFSDLNRPVPGTSRNRLDYLLDEPAFSPPESVCERKKWMEGGQRVVTRVLEEIQRQHPHVHRPEGRDGKKGKQKDFQDLYQTLRAAEKMIAIESSR